MSKRVSPLTVIGIILVILIMIAGFLFVHGDRFAVPLGGEIVTMDEGWSIAENGKKLETSKLSELKVQGVKRGDTFVLERTLTDEADPRAAVFVRSFQSRIIAYVDDEEVFSQGEEAYEEDRMPGRTICYIPLPEDYVGKTLRVEITAAERDAFTGIGPFTIGNQQDLFHEFLTERQLPHLFGTFLTLFAFFQFICAPYLIFRNRKLSKQLFSALMVLSVGAYMLSFYNLFNIYISNPEINTILEFLSIYGIPVSICGLLQYHVEGKAVKMFRNFTILNFTLLIAVIVLHFANIVHINRWLMGLYGLAVAEFIPFAIYLLRNTGARARHFKEDRMEVAAALLPIIGMVIFVAGAFVDMAMYLYAKNILGQESSATIMFTMIGGMVLALCQMISFLLQGVCYLRSEITKQTLLNMAYVDPLTGLSNRTSCESAMEQITNEGKEYTIISMDLDSLKKVNDTLGHARGDELIINFAEELKKQFSGDSMVGRMGGDEFLVILTGEEQKRALPLMDALCENLAELHRKDPEIPYSVSFGTAASTETTLGRRAYDIYLLADQRMYAMKRERRSGLEAANV